MENYVDNFDVLYRKNLHAFYCRLRQSKNVLIQELLTCFSFYGSKFMLKFYDKCTTSGSN